MAAYNPQSSAGRLSDNLRQLILWVIVHLFFIQARTVAQSGSVSAGVNKIWVELKNPRQVKAVYGAIPYENVDVLLFRLASGEYQVFSVDLSAASITWGTSAPSAGMPALDLRVIKGQLPGRKFEPGLVTLPATISGLNVWVNGFEHEYGVLLSQNLTLVPTATSSKTAWIGVGVNMQTNQLVQRLGTDRALAYLPQTSDAYEIAWNDYETPLAAVLVANGTTTLSANNTIVSLRRFIAPQGHISIDRVVCNDDGDVLTNDDGEVMYA
jgi:hypothetical protein